MDRVLVYTSDVLSVAGAPEVLGGTLGPLSYVVAFEEIPLLFHVKLAWKSELTFLCPACSATSAPTWWKDSYLLQGHSVLQGNYSDQAVCLRCPYEAPFSLRSPERSTGPPNSYHTTFTWTENLKEVLDPFLAAMPEVGVLESVLVLDELCEALIPIKGRLESERLRSVRL